MRVYKVNTYSHIRMASFTLFNDEELLADITLTRSPPEHWELKCAGEVMATLIGPLDLESAILMAVSWISIFDSEELGVMPEFRRIP